MSFQVPLPKSNIPVTANGRNAPEHINGASPKAGYKGPTMHRPQPLPERQKTALLKEADEELRRLKTQFDTMRTDPFIMKSQTGLVDYDHSAQSNQTSQVRGLQNPSQNVKPSTGYNGMPSASFNSEYRTPQVPPKKLAQSFEVNKNTFLSGVNPEHNTNSNGVHSDKLQAHPKQAYHEI